MVQDATPERDHNGAGKLDDFHRSISQFAGSRSLINYKSTLSSYWITEGRITRLKSVKGLFRTNFMSIPGQARSVGASR